MLYSLVLNQYIFIHKYILSLNLIQTCQIYSSCQVGLENTCVQLCLGKWREGYYTPPVENAPTGKGFFSISIRALQAILVFWVGGGWFNFLRLTNIRGEVADHRITGPPSKPLSPSHLRPICAQAIEAFWLLAKCIALEV